MLNRRFNLKSQRYGLITAILLLALVFGIGQGLAFWSEPDQTAPNSTTAQPIIAGDENLASTHVAQTKQGGLIVQGNLEIQNTINTTTLNTNSDIQIADGKQLCLNDACISSWGSLTGNYVHLNPGTADLGTPSLTSLAAGPESNSKIIPLANQFGIQATADQPTGDRTAAIVGESASLFCSGGESDGNPCDEDSDCNDGICANNNLATYGIAGLATNAAYCQGGSTPNVSCLVEDDPDPCLPGVCTPNNITRGVWGSDGGFNEDPVSWAGRFDGRVGVEGDLCLNGDCRNASNWGPIADDSLVKVQDSPTPVFQTGEVKVEGSAKTGQFVLGEPLPSTPVSITCGDGLCNYGGNGESHSTCPVDCR
ncbi:MAG: hypothetical protein V1853_05095 [bacterium]